MTPFPSPHRLHAFVVAAAVLLLAACSGTRFGEPQLMGAPAMIAVDGKPVLWVLTKQEEIRETRIGGGRRSSATTRKDTYYHFEVRAYDPATATPLWRQRLLTLGDPDAATNIRTTRILGSSESGYLLGQDGDRVWLQIADTPVAVSVRDGAVVATAETLEQANPELKGRLPSEARHYGFDGGLTILAADARHWVVRGESTKAEPYSVPPPPPPPPQPASLGTQSRLVPQSPPPYPPAARMVEFAGQRIGLYSEKEARSAESDQWGTRLAYPYTIDDEGRTARRTFWTVATVEASSFDETWQRIDRLAPVDGSPMFLRGRFLKKLPGDDALVLEDPPGLLVWHLSRMDDAGRLSLARVDESLQVRWNAELPLSENDTINPVQYWLVGDRVVVFGGRRTEADFVVGRATMLVSVALADGSVLAHDLTREPTDRHDPMKVPPRDAGPVDGAAAPR